MTEHTSDCALHNAPAKAPEPCTCGASRRFRLFGYNISSDRFSWRTFCRETLIVEAVANGLREAYRGDVSGRSKVHFSTFIARAARGLTGNERTLIAASWAESFLSDAVLDQSHGNLSALSQEDGLYLQLQDVPDITVPPTDEEIASAVGLYVPFWAELPEPAVTI